MKFTIKNNIHTQTLLTYFNKVVYTIRPYVTHCCTKGRQKVTLSTQFYVYDIKIITNYQVKLRNIYMQLEVDQRNNFYYLGGPKSHFKNQKLHSYLNKIYPHPQKNSLGYGKTP